MGDGEVISFAKAKKEREAEHWLKNVEIIDIPEAMQDLPNNKKLLISWHEEVVAYSRKRIAKIKRLNAKDDCGEIALEMLDDFPYNVEELIEG